MVTNLENAGALNGAALQESIDGLLASATALDALLETEEDVEAAQAIGRMQVRLRSQARALVDSQIDVITGEMQVSAAEINAATRYANDAIARIADWKKRLEQLGQVLDFFAAVTTGNAKAIFKSARSLKDSLDRA